MEDLRAKGLQLKIWPVIILWGALWGGNQNSDSLEADFSTLQNYDIAHLKTSIAIYEWFQAARGKWRYWGRFQK